MGVDRDNLSAAYEALVALAVREQALAAAGDLDAVLAVQHERVELVAALPPVAPAAARPLLERAAVLQAATTEILRSGLGETVRELRRLRSGRAVVQGYTPALPAPAAADRSA